ncbi:MAG: 4-hydroxy-3-methylbut-2-enyl diphosphate reductase [Acidobacteria bacterium]|nr:4-hydroxy-3-methylbut-2-enyl diphosphate reductase [Acidobacteriota bacterium]
MKVKRAEKYGFCSGVRIADMKVKRFARKGGTGSILGQVVHNERVVQEMADLGVSTVDSIEETTGPTIVFSAHGVPPSFHERATKTGLEVLDTTCKFVYDIHRESDTARDEGWHLVFIGDPNHREVIGYTNDLDPSRYHILSTVEQAEAIDWSRYPKIKVFYQTTLNAEEFEPVVRVIEAKGAETARADTICYATKENQEAAKALAGDPEVDVIVVVGGKKSANTRHLYEICRAIKPSYLVHEVEDIQPEWFEGASVVGLTAGSSTPDYMIDEVEASITGVREEVEAS